MDLNDVIAELRLPNTTELLQVLGVEWESSQRAMPPKELFFLDRKFVTDSCRIIGLSAEVIQAAVAVSERIAFNPALRALAWHFHHCILRCAAYPPTTVQRWPSVETLAEPLQEEGAMFYFLVLLSGLPKLQEIHRAHSVPADVTRDTLTDIEINLRECHRQYRTWGLSGPGRINWLLHHFRGALFRLSRLQFQFGPFAHRLRAFRHRKSSTVVALAEAGNLYLADGQVNGPGRIYDGDGPWTSELIFTDDGIIGNPILPTGCALQRKVSLPRSEWQQVLAPGDPVLKLHVPGGGPMSYDLCGESFRIALDFFPRHFPEKPFVAFCCATWLFDAQLEELLPATSNLVRFQKEGYLFPSLSDDLHLFKVAFGDVPEDPSKAPRRTTLQRALLDRLLHGEHLRARAGGFFLLAEDFQWGAQTYRKQSLPWQMTERTRKTTAEF